MQVTGFEVMSGPAVPAFPGPDDGLGGDFGRLSYPLGCCGRNTERRVRFASSGEAVTRNLDGEEVH